LYQTLGVLLLNVIIVKNGIKLLKKHVNDKKMTIKTVKNSLRIG